jgi:hypothetical protein
MYTPPARPLYPSVASLHLAYLYPHTLLALLPSFPLTLMPSYPLTLLQWFLPLLTWVLGRLCFCCATPLAPGGDRSVAL